MAVSPAYAEGLSRDVAKLYADAELYLLQMIARHLEAGIDTPSWAERKLLEVQLMSAQARRHLGTLDAQAAQKLAVALVKAYNRGQAGAVADLIAAQIAVDAAEAGLPAVQALLHETVQTVTGTHTAVLRTVTDIYRNVIRDVSGQVLVGTQTRRQVAQAALNRLAGHGITGFVDRAGRNWDLVSYVEMATRTATGRAAVDGHNTRLLEAGRQLVIVSDAPQECPICRPYEGRVLSLTPLVPEGADGTLEAARAGGLFHPNCRHSTSLYQPGVTKRYTDTADPDGDRARQQLRYLERQTRDWKRRAAIALDDREGTRARAKVRAYQARIREHTATTSAKRLPHREQIGTAR